MSDLPRPDRSPIARPPLPTRAVSGVAARLAAVPELGPTVSFELYPPRTPAAEAALWPTIARLAEVSPDFFSVTYGASGSSQHTSRAVVRWIVEHVGPAGGVVAHLTCIGSPRSHVREVAAELVADGVRDFLALRGDPPAGAIDWQPHPQGLRWAYELVGLLRELEAEHAHGPLSIGVAATPSALRVIPPGTAESAASAAAAGGEPLCGDLRALQAKQAAGADYAITQVFFEVEDYRRYLSAARAAGITIPLLPGVVPLVDPRRLRRLEEISGVPVPHRILERLDAQTDEERRRAVGTAMGVEFVQELLAAGAPGLHLYTFNQHRAALDLLAASGLA